LASRQLIHRVRFAAILKYKRVVPQHLLRDVACDVAG
jgi:hypothetical protein